MKPVLLYILYNDGLEFENVECDTVEEAHLEADKCGHYKPIFSIYTLYSNGRPKGIDWKLNTDHIANVRENKKATLRRGTWSDTEIQTLLNNADLTIVELAKSLKRPYNSVYKKVKELQENGKL